MDLFLLIKRKNLTIHAEANGETTTEELKQIISGIIDVQPHDQQLYYNNEIMDGTKSLIMFGLSPDIAKPQTPSIICLALRSGDGDFEQPEIIPHSTPPELPVCAFSALPRN